MEVLREVVFWAVVTLIAGFVGYVGRYGAEWLLKWRRQRRDDSRETANRREATDNEQAKVETERARAAAEKERAKLEKKRAKAAVKAEKNRNND
ncbi:MAG: hypothetical protein R6U88_06520 [Candidatus Bipolaricaulota bacterium]